MAAALKQVASAVHLEPRRQFAALPYRTTGGLKVLLITSRGTRRWVIPKGWPMKGKSAHASAAREALEEAGVVGHIDKAALGEYVYDKRLKTGQTIPCRVEVFPLKVSAQKRTWPEKEERTFQWFDVDEAAELVEEPALAKLIRKLAKQAATKD